MCRFYTFKTVSTCPKSQWVKPWTNGPLTRYAKLWVEPVPRMFSPPPRVSDSDMHHGTCVTQLLWCIQGALTSGLLWSWWREKCSRHSWRMRNPQFCVSGKRPMDKHGTMIRIQYLLLVPVTWHSMNISHEHNFCINGRCAENPQGLRVDSHHKGPL